MFFFTGSHKVLNCVLPDLLSVIDPIESTIAGLHLNDRVALDDCLLHMSKNNLHQQSGFSTLLLERKPKAIFQWLKEPLFT